MLIWNARLRCVFGEQPVHWGVWGLLPEPSSVSLGSEFGVGMEPSLDARC
jgi:hypothetical protein